MIIHPRVQKDYYGNTPNLEVFQNAYEESKSTVCYNGDIFSREDYMKIIDKFPQLETMMLGRGILRTPTLLGKLKGKDTIDISIYRGFHDELLQGYLSTIHGEKNAIFKMKEIWGYLRNSFHVTEDALRPIRMANDKITYEKAVDDFFRQAEIK